MTALLAHPFTLHVRELDQMLWRAVDASVDDVVDFPPEPKRATSSAPARQEEPSAEQIVAALEHEAGNVARAARRLELPTRYVLYRLMKKHGLSGG